MHSHDELLDVVWHKNVPLKVSICVWHLLRNRWPTKENLVRRGIIPIVCVSGCGNNETTDHLLIHCPIFGVLWQHVKTWIGFNSTDPQDILDHFTNLLIPREVLNYVGRFWSLSGCAAFMCFGMKGITCCSVIKLNLLCNFWKESKLLLYIGWKLKMCVFLLVTICGGNNLLPVWALVDCFFIYNYSWYFVDSCSALL